jgi:NAD(P)-dependent dehydrogenase (short-subunit alcohol dehydrogenase family)
MTAAGVALVTGAAGDIGHSTGRALRERGFTVVGWDIAPKPEESAASHWHQVDLTTEVADEIVADLTAYGQLRYVFHVTGGADADELMATDVARVPLDVFHRTVALNLTSAYIVVRATIGLLRQGSGDRAYTFVSSLNALGGYGAPGYSAAKAGLHGLTAALAAPLGVDGIRVNTVALGTTRTANYARLGERMGRPADFERLGRRFPRGSVLSPDEVAAALIAIGVANPAISGQVVLADAAQGRLRP